MTFEINGISFDFFQLYRGPDTRYTIDDLDAEVDYTFRVCPVRLSENGDLFGTNSPTLKYHVPPNADSNVTNSALLNHRGADCDVVDSPTSSVR